MTRWPGAPFHGNEGWSSTGYDPAKCVCVVTPQLCSIQVIWDHFLSEAQGPLELVNVLEPPQPPRQFGFYALFGAGAFIQLLPRDRACHLRQDTHFVANFVANPRGDVGAVDFFSSRSPGLTEKFRWFDYSRQATSQRANYHGTSFSDNPFALMSFSDTDPAYLPPINPLSMFWQAHVFVEEAPGVEIWWGYAGYARWSLVAPPSLGFSAWSGDERLPFTPAEGTLNYGP